MFWRIVGGLAQLALTICWLIQPEDNSVFQAIAPAILIGGGIAAQTLFGGKDKDKSLPPWAIELIKQSVMMDRTTGFVPDKQPFLDQIDAAIQEAMAGIPAGREAFNADLAGRGVYRSGEATGELYKSVYAPVARAATSAAVQGRVGYEQLALDAKSRARQEKLQALQLLIQSLIPGGDQTSVIQDLFSGLGSAATQYGTFQLQAGELAKLGLA